MVQNGAVRLLSIPFMRVSGTPMASSALEPVLCRRLLGRDVGLIGGSVDLALHSS